MTPETVSSNLLGLATRGSHSLTRAVRHCCCVVWSPNGAQSFDALLHIAFSEDTADC